MNLEDRIPIAVLTGFLGSGKTTVLRHLSSHGALARTLVLVNEFGEVGLDHELLTPIDDDTLVAVGSGCICCTIRADLVQTLKDAPWRYSREGQRWFDRVIIETTGIADPAPILQTILGDRYVAERYLLTGVITAVDAVNGLQTLVEHPETVKQVAVADHILLTKTDLVASDDGLLTDKIAELSPQAQVERIIGGAADAEVFLRHSPFSLQGKHGDVEAWLNAEAATAHQHDHSHEHADRNRHGRIQASCLTFSTPVDPALFESCLQMLMEFRGADLLRVKGIINVAGMEVPMVIHGVQHVFHPPEILPTWPSEDRRTKVVVIAQNLNHAELTECFAGFGVVPDVQADHRMI